MSIIEVNSLCKSYNNRKIIDNLSFSVKEKSITAIIGESGCGKSTLLNMIGMLETIDKGTIHIYGKLLPKINSNNATKLRRNTINYLFQSFALITDKTVVENLLLAMNFVDISKKDKIIRINKILKQLNIYHLKNDKVNTLSGGEQQRVALARCILKPGDIILADEPTGSLDNKMADVVFNLLKVLRDEYNKTIIIVTHDMNLAQQSDCVIRLNG